LDNKVFDIIDARRNYEEQLNKSIGIDFWRWCCFKDR